MLSIIIPAHNEAFELPGCLTSVFGSAKKLAKPFEVIVVNDASTDATAEIARLAGARVIDVNLRKISAVRNAGAKVALGEHFLFVDADTQISENTLRPAVAALEAGAVGGGAWVVFPEPVGAFIRFGLFFFSVCYMEIAGWAAGCFFFARRDAFEKVGGFDENLYACEEIILSRALKRQGHFVVLRQPVVSSARKMRLYSPWAMIKFNLRLLRYGPSLLRTPKNLDWWYEGKREKKERA